jgi:cytochrome c553
MAEVARRFELFGRATSAGRFELAEYQLGEIEELFVETLPHAMPPREGHPEVLNAMASAFAQSTVVDLRRGMATRDGPQVTAAFERAATACNACHQASGHGFIEVPTLPGRSIPNLDPLPPASP